jgi:hypothetical protein
MLAGAGWTRNTLMKRLAIALSCLLCLNLLTTGLRWLVVSQRLSFANVGLIVLVGLGVVTLTYFATLEASPHYSLYHREAKVYAAAALAGVLLGLL